MCYVASYHARCHCVACHQRIAHCAVLDRGELSYATPHCNARYHIMSYPIVSCHSR